MHEKKVTSVDFSPDDEKIVSGGYDKKIIFMITNSLYCYENWLRVHTGLIYSVKYSSDGTKIVSGGSD